MQNGRVAGERVVGHFPLPGFHLLGGEFIGVDPGECVLHEVQQVVCVTALSRGTEQDHRFRDAARGRQFDPEEGTRELGSARFAR